MRYSYFLLGMVIFVVMLFVSLLFIDKLVTFNSIKTYNCDIGEKSVAGDYVKLDYNINYNYNHMCAVEDCEEFNNYQKEVGGTERCVV